MESALDYYSARALLEWQVELGATESLLDAPLNRYEVPAKQDRPKPIKSDDAPRIQPKVDPVEVAKQVAAGAKSLDELQQALAAFNHCDLRRGARQLVFSDGNPAARVMIIGEAPGRDEDRIGKPFVGKAGQMLDRMFEAIDMGREAPDAAQSIYVTNVMPWRPPQNQIPNPEDIAMLRPFLQRHVELVAPDVIVLMGNMSCQAILGERGFNRLRGQWQQAFGRPALPMFHPEHLLTRPNAKREAWADLLNLQAKLREL